MIDSEYKVIIKDVVVLDETYNCRCWFVMREKYGWLVAGG
jgi:hypothetical protein